MFIRFDEVIYNYVYDLKEVRDILMGMGWKEVYFAPVHDLINKINEPEKEGRVFISRKNSWPAQVRSTGQFRFVSNKEDEKNGSQKEGFLGAVLVADYRLSHGYLLYSWYSCFNLFGLQNLFWERDSCRADAAAGFPLGGGRTGFTSVQRFVVCLDLMADQSFVS